MDFGLFNTWNALYADGKVPWDPDYSGGKLLEEEAYARNFEEIDAVEEMGWDYLWLGGGHFSKQAGTCCRSAWTAWHMPRKRWSEKPSARATAVPCDGRSHSRCAGPC